MAQDKVFLALACLAIVFATNAKVQAVELTDEQLEDFKKDIDEEISEKNVTCENYNKVCEEIANEDEFDFSEFCEPIFKTYLCEGPQNLDTVKRISEQLAKAMATKTNRVF